MRQRPIERDTKSKRADADRQRSEAELERQAGRETEAGLGIPIEEVEAWVGSWDTANELPMPKARQVK